MERTIQLKKVLPFPTDKVWRALTEPELLGSWFMKNNIIPEVGGYFTFEMAPQKGWEGITHCEVIAVESERYIAYTYRGKATGEKTLACAGVHSEAADKIAKGLFTKLDTVLSFALETTCGGTILTLKHSGYKGLKLIIVSFIMQMGWEKQLNKRLPKVLEQM